MTDKRILIEVPDTDSAKVLEERFQKGVQAIMYTKDFLKVQEIDLDDGTVRDIDMTHKKILFTRQHDSLNFNYEVEK